MIYVWQQLACQTSKNSMPVATHQGILKTPDNHHHIRSSWKKRFVSHCEEVVQVEVYEYIAFTWRCCCFANPQILQVRKSEFYVMMFPMQHCVCSYVCIVLFVIDIQDHTRESCYEFIIMNEYLVISI